MLQSIVHFGTFLVFETGHSVKHHSCYESFPQMFATHGTIWSHFKFKLFHTVESDRRYFEKLLHRVSPHFVPSG